MSETNIGTRVRRRAPNEESIFQFVKGLLAQADVEVGGSRPRDIRLNDNDMPRRVLAHGSLGLGEAYMDGRWECDHLDQFFARVLRARLDEQVRPGRLVLHALRARMTNRQTARRSWRVGERHYDIGNEFYAAMLDHRMTYTCAWWSAGARSLDAAQEDKLDLICCKLQLRPGMRLLDIGCGWGSLMGFAAEYYGVKCVGVTISREQAQWAAQRYQGLPLEFRLQDYRTINERFDRIASIGMFEHVGPKNYRTYMKVAHRCLTEDGIFLLHTIGKNRRETAPDPWIDRYIFPNGELPAIGQIADAAAGLFVTEDLHNFGADYDRTLMSWHANFESAWLRFEFQFGPRFYRMWRYYLLSCAGLFRAREAQLWQWIFTRNGMSGGYHRPSNSHRGVQPHEQRLVTDVNGSGL